MAIAPTTSVREDAIEAIVITDLAKLTFNPEEKTYLMKRIAELKT
jgi:hypothetical protein